MRWLAVAVLVVVSACQPRPPYKPGDARLVTTSATLEAGTAVRYNDPLESPRTNTVTSAILDAMRDTAKRNKVAPPVADARMFRACEALAGIVSKDGTLPFSAIQFAFQSNGIVEPSPVMLITWDFLDQEEKLVDALQPALDKATSLGPNVRIGIGAVQRAPAGNGAVVVAFVVSELQTTPIPREIPAFGSAEFELTLGLGLRDPKIIVLRPNEELDRPAVRPTKGNAFRARIDCAATKGTLQIEISATAMKGRQDLAVFPLWCGEQPPRSLVINRRLDDPPIDPREAEKVLLDLLNRDRQRAGRAPLVLDDTLGQLAREHSETMRRTDVITSNDLSGRAETLVAGAYVAANVARTHGVDETHHGFMSRAGTRPLMMSKSATHIGIGVAYGDVISNGTRPLFITQLIAMPSSTQRIRWTGVAGSSDLARD